MHYLFGFICFEFQKHFFFLINCHDEKTIEMGSNKKDKKQSSSNHTMLTTSTNKLTKRKSWFSWICISISILIITIVLPVVLAFLASRSFLTPPWYSKFVSTPLEGFIIYFYGLLFDFIFMIYFDWSICLKLIGLRPRAAKTWQNFHRSPMEEFNLTFIDVEFEGPNNSTLRGWHIPGNKTTSKKYGKLVFSYLFENSSKNKA
jgi:hypothetical protein